MLKLPALFNALHSRQMHQEEKRPGAEQALKIFFKV
jgi:hypothetical protein